MEDFVNNIDMMTLYSRYKLKNNNIEILEELLSTDHNTFILHVYDNKLLTDSEYHEFKYDDYDRFEECFLRKYKIKKIIGKIYE